MRAARAALLIGEHDFSAFRSAECQAAIAGARRCARSTIARRGAYWRFDFDANAFLHHMVRNIMGCLVAVGSGTRARRRGCAEVLAARDRSRAAPTFAPDGLYFVGPYYDPAMRIPDAHAAPWTGCPDAPCGPHEPRTRIKICGLTREADVEAAVEAGADAIGFVFYPTSPRHVTLERAARAGARACRRS